MHIGNESKLCIKRMFGWCVELDHLLENGSSINPHRLELAVRIYSNYLKRYIFWAVSKDVFENGEDSNIIAQIQMCCRRLFAITHVYLKGSYPYEQFMCFYAGNLLKDKVQESKQNKGFKEDALESHEGLNRVHKTMSAMSNHTLKGLEYLLEATIIRQIGGMQYNYYNFDKMSKPKKKYLLFEDDCVSEMIEFRNNKLTMLTEETAKLVQVLMDIPDDALFEIPEALKPYTENMNMDLQIKKIEALKAKVLRMELKALEKKCKLHTLKIDHGEEYNAKELTKQIKKHIQRVTKWQKQSKSKRQRPNQSTSNLLQ